MKKLNSLLLFLVGTAAAVFMIIDGEVCAEGVREGLKSCADTLIPTLFPFMILSKLMVQSDALKITERLFAKPLGFLFRLPPAAAPAVIISFVGGFPVGASLADSLYRSGKLDRTQLEIMLSFCVCGGPAFIIGAVGERLFGNALCGVIIYASIILAAICVGFFTARMLKAKKPSHTSVKASPPPPFSACLVSSVEESTRSMLIICAFVLLFSAVNNIISTCLPWNSMADAVSFPLEVTTGVMIAANRYGLPAAAALCSFSGLAVICQILALQSEKINILRFFLCRLSCALLAFCFSTAALRLFPGATPVYKNFEQSSAAISGDSLMLSVFLLLMSVVFLWSLGKDTPSKLDFTCDV